MFEREEIGLDIVGTFLIFIGAFAIGYSIYLGSIDAIFWFCYIGLVILGLGILFENGDIVISQLNILTIPAIIWAVDFISLIASGKSILGITDYFWQENFIQKIISLQHLFAIPLAFYGLSLIKVKRTGIWKFSFLQVALTYLIVRTATSPLNNINYVFASFLPIQFGSYYPLAWLGISFLGIFATNFFIIRFAEFNE